MKNKKLIVAALALVLVLSVLCGCGYNPKTVATIEDYEVPAGVYLAMQLSAYGSLANENGADPAKLDFLDTEVNGVSARELVNQKTMDMLAESVFVEKEYERLGLELTDMDEYYINYYVSQTWGQYGAYYEKNGINQASFADVQTRSYKSSLLVDKLYGVDGEKAFSDDEFRAYYNEHYTKIDYIEFPLADNSGAALSTETVLAVSEVITKMLADAKENDSIEHAFLAYFDEVAAIVGSEQVADEASFQSAFRPNAAVSDLNGSFTPEFFAQAKALKVGEYDVFNTGTSIYLYKANGLAEDEDYSGELSTMTMYMAAEPFEAYVKENTANYTVSEDKRAREYYSLDKMIPIVQQ